MRPRVLVGARGFLLWEGRFGMARSLALIAGLQALRWALESLAFAALGRTPLVDSAVRTVVYLLLLAVLVVAARRCGTRLHVLPERRTRGWALACAACAGLVVSTPFLTGQAGTLAVWAELACAAVATPLFEEALFRGCLWARFEGGTDGGRAALDSGGCAPSDAPTAFPWRTVIATALLFGLWHLGYVDVVAWQLDAEGFSGMDLAAACAGILAGKVVLGAGVGLALGAARARWGCMLPAVLLHAAWNALA